MVLEDDAASVGVPPSMDGSDREMRAEVGGGSGRAENGAIGNTGSSCRSDLKTASRRALIRARLARMTSAWLSFGLDVEHNTSPVMRDCILWGRGGAEVTARLSGGMVVALADGAEKRDGW